jgi:serine/threonine protein kinase
LDRSSSNYWSSSSDDIAQEHASLLNINGILLEFIPGISFAEISEDNVPRTSWQEVVDQAIQITHIFSDHNILNEDVRPANILATPDSTKAYGYRAVMIDFGYSKFREEYESDLAWGRAKHTEDEEGAVGSVMATRLKGAYGFELKFGLSRRYAQYAEPESLSLYT